MTAQFLASVITLLVAFGVIMLGVAYGILLERRLAAWVQDRIGPNRVGFSFGLAFLPSYAFWGLGQPLADGLKMLLKEDYTPPGVDRRLFLLAPVLAIVPAVLAWAVIPWGGYLQWGDTALNITGLPVNVGAIYVLAIGSLAVYGVVVGGYASNNKYAFLGALRATAQMLSYEIPLGLAVLVVILMAGTPQTDLIVAAQTTGLRSGGLWFVIYQPLLAVLFFTGNLAECNRAPFDLAEAEQELVAGYHTEYSSMKFALFYLSEYMHMITTSAFFTLLFLGGWSVSPLGLWPDLPLVGGLGLVALKFGVFVVKVFALVSLMMLVRWTLPRFRFDQLMKLAWRAMIPLGLALLLVTGGLLFLHTRGLLTRPATLWLMLAANGAVAALTLVGGALLPSGPPVNRRVPLEGSRFSAPPAAEPTSAS